MGPSRWLGARGALLGLAAVFGAWSLSLAQDRSVEPLPREVSDREARPLSIAANGAIRWQLIPREAAGDGDSVPVASPGDAPVESAGRPQPEEGASKKPEAPGLPLPAVWDDLTAWGGFVEPRRGPLIVARDGGMLAADVVELNAAALTIDHAQFGERTLPVAQLRAIVLQWPSGRAARDRVAIECARPSRSDGRAEILLDNGDRLLGRISLGRDGRMELGRADRSDTVPPDRVALIRLPASFPEEALRADAASRRSWVGWADGSCLLVEQLTIDGDDVSFRAFGGDWKGAARALRAIQPIGGRVVYLSDRQPNAFRHVPFLDVVRSYALDATVTGGWPVCRGRLYRKAIGMHSAARLGFAVEPRAVAFAAAVGIDDTTDGGGSVRVRVFVDGRPQWASEIIRGGQPPVDLFVRLDGAGQLDLVVDYAERADVLDRVLWLNPRVILRAE